jgi:hypothetical protein
MTHEFTESLSNFNNKKEEFCQKIQKKPTFSAIEWMLFRRVITSKEYDLLTKYFCLQNEFSVSKISSSWPKSNCSKLQWHAKNKSTLLDLNDKREFAETLFYKMKSTILKKSHLSLEIVERLLSEAWPKNFKNHLKLYLKAIKTLFPFLSFYIDKIDEHWRV